jgi:hypothetical protein
VASAQRRDAAGRRIRPHRASPARLS